MKRSGESHDSPDVSVVKWNIEKYVELFQDDCLTAERLAEDFIDILAKSGHTDSAIEFLTLLPHNVVPIVKSMLRDLREGDYRKVLTPSLGCRLSEPELVEYAEELRPNYKALDVLINDPAVSR